MADPVTNPALDSTPIAMEYALGNEEILESWVWRYFRGPRGRAERQLAQRVAMQSLVWVIGATIGSAALLYFTVQSADSPSGWVIVAASVGLLVWWFHVLRAIADAKGERKYVTEWLAQLARKSGSEPAVRMTLSTQGLEWSTECSRHQYTWAAFVAAYETDTLLMLEDKHGDPVYIPKRLFGEGAARSTARERVLRWLHNGGGGQINHLSAVLADRDVECPACHYNLRGVKMPVCPECGLVLDRYAVEGLPRE